MRLMTDVRDFKEIWSADFEFSQPPGFRSTPRCLVARELKSGQTIRVWEDELLRMKAPPYSCGKDSLFVAYFASAEVGCHLSLNWELPENILDLYAEFRCLTNGKAMPLGNGLFGALNAFGINDTDTVEKEVMRELAIRGGPWTQEERAALLDYCESDVVALEKLLPKMLPRINLGQAILRGRYMKAIARMEFQGIHIDDSFLNRFVSQWDEVRDQLIEQVDFDYGIYENGRFNEERFRIFLYRMNIQWPIHPSTGRLKLDDDTFKDMSRKYSPLFTPLRDLRSTLQKMRKFDLAVGPDSRNRCLLSPFSTTTGRNQAGKGGSQFIFNMAKWFRHFMVPPPGYGLAYIDYAQQEFGIAAALSKCKNMQAAYSSGDSYLAFAQQAGALTGSSPPDMVLRLRSQYKATALAVLYGGGVGLIEFNTGLSTGKAKELLKKHKELYSEFWEWSEAISNSCFLQNQIETVFGWKLRIDRNEDVNPRSVINFPMQANGAEILRLACIALTESGIKVCAPIHDALLIEAPLDLLEEQTKLVQHIMADASGAVLNGFRLRTTAQVTRYPNRFRTEEGEAMWDLIQTLVLKSEEEYPQMDTIVSTNG
ncbi:MAG: DNA polymerase [Pseudobdellovibrionaceae bacterium]